MLYKQCESWMSVCRTQTFECKMNGCWVSSFSRCFVVLFKHISAASAVMLLLSLLFFMISTSTSQDSCVFRTDSVPYVKIENNSVTLEDTTRGYASTAMGNYITLYYNTRGLAKYLNVCFYNERVHDKNDEWLAHLPRKYCPPPTKFANASEALNHIKEVHSSLTAMCQSCKDEGFKWLFPHECKGLWLTQQKEMKVEIKQALVAYSKHTKQHIPIYNDTKTSVIYSRCKAGDSIMGHGAYGPVGFSFYKTAVKVSSHIVIVARAHHGICLEIRNALVKYLKVLKPTLTIIHQNSTAFGDYSSLVFAHRLFADVSTFAITAGMAKEGEIYLPSNQWTTNTIGVPNFRIVEYPVFLPEIGKDAGVKCSGDKCVHFDAKSTKIVLDWLNSH